MSNIEATGKKAKRGPELVQRIRAAILNTFDAVEKDGQLISEILAEQFKENPLKFMDMASKYCPREIAMDLEADIGYEAEELSDTELTYIAATGRKRTVGQKRPAKQPTQVH